MDWLRRLPRPRRSAVPALGLVLRAAGREARPKRSGPEHLLQIAIYGYLLGTVQGWAADHGSLMLGTGEPATPYLAERFRLDSVRL